MQSKTLAKDENKIILKVNPTDVEYAKELIPKLLSTGQFEAKIFVTGDIVSITSNGETKMYSIVIKGDVNGNGTIDVFDLLRVQKQLLKSLSLNNSEYKACDINKDGEVTILDLLLVQKWNLEQKK